ncbi:unnamed protein product, partial [Adineta steineri]
TKAQKQLDDARVNLGNCSHVNDPTEWADLLNKVTDIAIEFGKIQEQLKTMQEVHIERGGTLPYTEDVSTVFTAPHQSSSSNSINKINTVINSSSIQLGLTSPNDMRIGKGGSLPYVPNIT